MVCNPAACALFTCSLQLHNYTAQNVLKKPVVDLASRGLKIGLTWLRASRWTCSDMYVYNIAACLCVVPLAAAQLHRPKRAEETRGD